MVPNAHPLPNGMVVIFEGIDGTGKTTQIELARTALEAAGWPVTVVRNLGGTPVGEALREVILSPLERPPLTDFYISLAIQAPLLDVIDAARAKGKIVLMDRGPLSLAAYQIFGAGIDAEVGWRHVQAGMDRLKTEAIILYEADIEKVLQRGRQHSGKADYFESKPLSYFQKVSAGYRMAAERFPVTAIDAGQPVQAVHERTMARIAAALSA